jgi:RNase adapter protein RapZ
VAEFVIITGMSGAGRSTVSNAFEDLGWFVIDNMPLLLVGKVAELVEGPNASIDKVAFVVGRNAPEELSADDTLTRAIDQLTAGGSRVRVVFLDAATEVLIRRYEGSRRRHPLAEYEGVGIGIHRERTLLESVKARADLVIDTGNLTVHQLRDRVADFIGVEDRTTMAINVVSFGFKHGLPGDVDLVFDLRFLPNPHWVETLRPFTGKDEPVRAYVLTNPDAQVFLGKIEDLLLFLIPRYITEGKSYLSIAIGCTGGQHRSVAVSEELTKVLQKHGYPANVRHRDIEKRG